MNYVIMVILDEKNVILKRSQEVEGGLYV